MVAAPVSFGHARTGRTNQQRPFFFSRASTVAASAQPGSEPSSAGADDFDFDEALRAMEMRDAPPQQDGSRREPIVAKVT